LQKIQKKKTLDWLQLTPEESKEVMDYDDQHRLNAWNASGGTPPTEKPPAMPPALRQVNPPADASTSPVAQ